ncbi:MAG: glutamate-5-semialdehyde dehydrogenase [Gammaproteobacteria bacterium]|nr:glutamate-5-semialdehyde dehydrogenase [Gammaproteobacteria bacterium]
MLSIGQSAREASRLLAAATSETKNNALYAMAKAIRAQKAAILTANNIDVTEATQKGTAASFIDRLTLHSDRIEAMAKGLETIAELPEPVGKLLEKIERPNGLIINRISVPIGVIGVIYESRPNVTADAAGLCLKSGNAVILRGGSESFRTATAIMQAITEGLQIAKLPLTTIQMIPTVDRAAINEMTQLDKYIDVIIPRGGQKLVEAITVNCRIPLFKHLSALCHTYIHEAANIEMAKTILLNAKMRRTGICGATDTLLIDESIAATQLPLLLDELIRMGCEIRGDQAAQHIDHRIKLAREEDYDTEFLDAIMAVKIVKDVSQAIKHISEHSTQHTDAIITDDAAVAKRFLQEVDSAIVVHNASTQFADGGEFGMGAEIGIATGKLHARGPVGINQLTTFKYQVHGNGQTRPQ